MQISSSLDDPLERRARPDDLRRATFTVRGADPADPALHSLLRAWTSEARALLEAPAAPLAASEPAAAGARLDPETRLRLQDGLRILDELLRVLCGEEPGEGRDEGRAVWIARSADGRAQGVCSTFVCRRAVFVELLAAAPWNLLGPGARGDPRAVRGTGKALVAHATRVSRAAGRGGRVALQAENVRCLRAYEHLGFARMRPSDVPLALVPRGPRGWSPSLLRVARGRSGPEEERCPWLLLDPSPSAPAVRMAAAAA
ncbi:MAG TPA: N-acetyltransferase [Anaeromyxobacteraceae bacterium]|nr:N-acetyltransferase [Anaeromyxobacteraceae bacterium]